MKHALLLVALLSSLHLWAQFLPDVSFGDQGRVPLDGSFNSAYNRVARSHDGSFFVKMNIHLTASYVVHLLADGTPNPDFGIDGRVQFNDVYLEDIAVQADGKLLLCGSRPNAIPSGFVLRLDHDGIPDDSFGENGFFQAEGLDNVGRMTVTNDGKILASGIALAGLTPEEGGIQTIRLLLDGTLDPTYTNNLLTTPCIPGLWWPMVDGSFLATTQVVNEPEVRHLIRIDADGLVDDTFNNGLGYYPAPYQWPYAIFDVALDAQGRILALLFTPGKRVIIRLLSSGVPDITFGLNGIAETMITHQPAYDPTGKLIDVDPEGRIVVAYRMTDDQDQYHVLLTRYGSNGMVEPAFGAAGSQLVTPSLLSYGSGLTWIIADGADRIKLLYAHEDALDPDLYWMFLGLSGAGIGVNETLAGPHFQLYPNPTDDRITVVPDDGFIEHIELHDAYGRNIRQERVFAQGPISLDVADLAPGCYAVTVVDKGQRSTTRTLLKE